MNAVSQWLQQIWYGNRMPPWPLRVLASQYAAWLALRPQARPAAQTLPLLVVGNMVAGGSGKTPLVLHLARFLLQSGLRIAVIARVYQGSERAVHVLHDNSTTAQVGDEPLLLYQRLRCPVVVSRKRRYAYDYIVNKMQEVDLIISDDGLQHRHFQAAIGVGVVSAKRGFGNARLLPAGPLREPLQGLQALDYLVVKTGLSAPAGALTAIPGWPAQLSRSSAINMRVAVTHAERLRDGEQRPLSAFAQQQVSALAAIADPEAFFAMLREHGLHVTAHALPDHSHVPDTLWQALPHDRPVLVTGKDAVKIARDRIDAGAPDIWAVPLHTELPQHFLQDLLQRCRTLTCRAV